MSDLIVTANTTDKCLIPDVRNAYHRRLNIGTAWSEVRIGMFFTFVPYNNDDAACTTETCTFATQKDSFTFGLATSDDFIPGMAGGKFIGARSGLDSSDSILDTNSAGTGQVHANFASYSLRFQAWSGATRLSNNESNSSKCIFPIFNASSKYGYLGIRFVVVNAGLSSQAIRQHWLNDFSGITDVSIGNLRTVMLTAHNDSGADSVWNESGAAITLPDWFYVRSPFYNNRIRITTHGAVKIA